MDFRGLVWKRVWKITFFGLKSGQDLENRAAHRGGTPPPRILRSSSTSCILLKSVSLFQAFRSWGRCQEIWSSARSKMGGKKKMKKRREHTLPQHPPPPSRPLAVFFCSHLFASICIYTLTQYTACSARFSTRSIFLYRMIYKYGKIILTSRVRYQVSLAHKYS